MGRAGRPVGSYKGDAAADTVINIRLPHKTVALLDLVKAAEKKKFRSELLRELIEEKLAERLERPRRVARS